ncbi:Tudor domain-containing protein 7 [Desmophyllum pertusum]|uniref:Tudor domain-containing protein 7 n=1 Tax=Desmophyllum pertusum TaxID=174260 RepID=A0A9W9ZQ31_9CNID|nr:Tudor domain-containing protein 7 [Desmophyllum pertusum]
MRELATRCKKPLITLDNIGAQEFDILVTDVIDSCHFWANIDDQIGSYKKLEQIRTDLQIVEHHERCMPVKYQLGASRFSEDNLWYRCWCVEVSKLERREAKVFYIDYGNGEWISWDQFTDIHKKFWDLAPQAVPFKLAGLENASNLSPEILNEGSKYLDALICNKVCRARTCQPSDPNKPHIIEVELIIKKEGNVPVNKQMALTRYVQETRNAPHVVQGPLHNHSIQEINLTPSQQQTTSTLQPQQPAKQTPPCRPFVNTQNAQAQPQTTTTPQPQQPVKQTPPQPFVNTQNAQAQPQQPAKQTSPRPSVNTQNAQAQPQQPAKQTSPQPFVNTQSAQAQPQTTTTPQPQLPAKQTPPQPFVNTPNALGTQAAVQFAQPVQQSVNQELLPSKQSVHSQQSSESSLANSPQSGQDRIGQQSLQQDQKVEPVDKSPPRTLQHQQQLPSYMYQLFEKKEVIKIMLSYVISPDEIYFFMADYKTQQNLRRMSRALVNDVNPKAKIYPRVGDIVIRISERGRFYRVRIRSIPKSAALGVDKVAIQSVDYGWRELAPLSSLCELPPQSLRSLPPQVMHAKLAGIKRKEGMPCYSDVAIDNLITVKSRREVIQASVVKRQEDGILLVELFESEGPSLNVQFLKMNWAQLDESQRSLFCANFTPSSSDDSGLSPTQRSNNLPLTSNQIPKWHPQENIHHIDNQSNHSDWEDSLIEIEEDWMDATPVTGAREDASRRQSWDHLYIPPPPEMHSPSSAGLARSVPLGTLPSSDIHPPSLGGSVSSGTHDIQAPSAAASSVPHNVRLPTSGGLGSASSGPLGIPPPSDIRPSSSEGSVSSGLHDLRSPSTATSASSVPPNVRLPSAAATSVSSVPPNVRPPSSGGSGSASSGPHDLRSPSTATSASSVAPNVWLHLQQHQQQRVVASLIYAVLPQKLQ